MKLTNGQPKSAVVDIDRRDRITVASGLMTTTFSIKDDLKSLGMKWDSVAQVWFYQPSSDDDAVDFLKKLDNCFPGLESRDADMVEFVNSL